jgi:hypothetical protein
VVEKRNALGLKSISVAGVLLLGVSLAAAQGRKDGDKAVPPPKQFAPNIQRRGPIMHGPGPHMGDWLRRYDNLPADQQIKALEADPVFRGLPQEKQDQLRNRLARFNSLNPEQKERILQRMETLEHLPPDQQQKAHDLFRSYRELAPDRRHALTQGFEQLQGLSPQERQKMLESDTFRNNYSEQERDLLRGMSTLGFAPGRGRNPPPQ